MPTPVPTGTVTFLFTDIEGSTRLWQRQPEAMKRALERHHGLLQQAIESNGGYVFQIVGDAFCAAFHTVSAGVGAALAAQRALARESWGGVGPILVRMALHTGAAELRAGEHKSGEYASSLTLSHTARLLSVAYGGQILVSAAGQAMLHDDQLPQVELRDLGHHRLRDLARAEHIYQVVTPDLPSVFPVLASAEAALHNLPRQLTTFVGRDREIADLKRRLADTRLLTLTGPGGSGKTRLSLEVGTALLSEYVDGVWLLEFAPVSDPLLAAQVLATTLGVREDAGRSLVAALVDRLRARRTLLLFDNCEHLIEACASLAETILRACSEVRILASSREPLGLTGEVVFRVPPLSVPEPREVPSLDQLTRYEAVRLFVDRAVAVKPDFVLTETAALAVAQICRRLDGIPLAIELAAARTRTLSVPQIAAHLDERFRLLTGGSRTALPRHQTLRGLIDWSYDLLAGPERALFRRLSVFAGGFTLEGAEVVGMGQDVGRLDVVDLLGRLVDKSLVVMDDQGSEVRYHLLETIRQYALERLTESGEGASVRGRHRDFYLGVAEAAAQELQGPDQVVWLRRLEADHDNVRAALRWSLDHAETELTLRFGSALWAFWDTRWYIREGREWLDEVLALARGRPPAVPTPESRRSLARVLDGAANLCARWSEFARTIELQTEALEVWRELGDKRGIAEALNQLGDRLRQRGDRPRGRTLMEESLALFRDLGDRRGIAHALNNLAELLGEDGDHAGAQALCEESVPLLEALEDWRGLSRALDNLGGMLTSQGEYTAAEPLYTRSLQLAEELGDNHAIATVRRSLAGAAHGRHDHARARGLYEDSIARFQAMDDAFCLARSLLGLAQVAHATGERESALALEERGLALLRATEARGELATRLDEIGLVALEHQDMARARASLQEALVLRAEAQDASGTAMTLEHLARVIAAGGRTVAAVRLLAAAEAWRQRQGVRGPERDRQAGGRVLAQARAQLPGDDFEAARSEGAALTLERAVAHACDQLSERPAE